MIPTRRQLLHASLGAGAALCWRMTQQPPSALAVENQLLLATTRTSRALGTKVSITAMHERAAEPAIDDAFAAIEQVEALMSIYRDDSQLSRLNRDGWLADPHPLLVRVLRHAQDLSRRTRGAFDVTVQPLWTLHSRASQEARRPSEKEIAAARKLVDWRAVQVRDDCIRLARPGMQVTLNGVAQGLAADRAAEALHRAGVRHALVDCGELAAEGGKTASDAWTVGVQHPRNPDAYVSLAALRDRCLATSGDYATRFGDDYEYNHLFDPRTGRSPAQLASVSVAAASSMQADALSTALFVLGVERGLELIRQTPDADALLVLKSGRMLATAGFPLVSEESSHG
ncbi:MAG: FAD:protein FMN transferase [Pirellulaceae bacterium]